jgi:hypothetical protein
MRFLWEVFMRFLWEVFMGFLWEVFMRFLWEVFMRRSISGCRSALAGALVTDHASSLA